MIIYNLYYKPLLINNLAIKERNLIYIITFWSRTMDSSMKIIKFVSTAIYYIYNLE